MAEPEPLAPSRLEAVPGATVCRHCGAPLELTMVDLGTSPLCQTVLTDEDLERGETFYPLHVRVCERCWLAQLPELAAPEQIFTEYAYFSAYSDSWVEHARRYVDQIIGAALARLRQPRRRARVERRLPAPALPAEGDPGVWESSRRATWQRLRWPAACRRSRSSSAPSSAHDWRPSVALRTSFSATTCWPRCRTSTTSSPASPTLLAPDGTATFEFPHLAKLIEHLEYDTIYHEHFSYFSLHSIRSIFGAQGLDLVDVEELPSHGGSLRVFLATRRRRSDPGARRLPSCSRARTSRGSGSRVVRAVRRRRARVQAGAPRAPDRAPARREAGRRLRRAGEGQHAAQLLWDPHRLPRLHRRPQPVQAGQAHARARTSRSIRPRRSPRRGRT